MKNQVEDALLIDDDNDPQNDMEYDDHCDRRFN